VIASISLIVSNALHGFMVRSVVEEPPREKFDQWYSTHHLPMALAEFKAEKCWRFWSVAEAERALRGLPIRQRGAARRSTEL